MRRSARLLGPAFVAEPGGATETKTETRRDKPREPSWAAIGSHVVCRVSADPLVLLLLVLLSLLLERTLHPTEREREEAGDQQHDSQHEESAANRTRQRMEPIRK